MPDFSEEEILDLMKALVEWKARLERLDPYPAKERDIQPYAALIQKLQEYLPHH